MRTPSSVAARVETIMGDFHANGRAVALPGSPHRHYIMFTLAPKTHLSRVIALTHHLEQALDATWFAADVTPCGRAIEYQVELPNK